MEKRKGLKFASEESTYTDFLPSSSFDPSHYSPADVEQGNLSLLVELQAHISREYDSETQRLFEPLVHFLSLDQNELTILFARAHESGAMGNGFSLSYLRSHPGTRPVWEALIGLIHRDKDREILLAILGQSHQEAQLTNSESIENEKREIMTRLGNIFHLALFASAEGLSHANEQVRLTEKAALEEFYGQLPKEFGYEAEAMVLNAKVESATREIKDARRREVVKAGLSALAPAGVKFWKTGRKRAEAATGVNWTEFLPALKDAELDGEMRAGNTEKIIVEQVLPMVELLLGEVKRSEIAQSDIGKKAWEEANGLGLNPLNGLYWLFARSSYQKKIEKESGLAVEVEERREDTMYANAHSILSILNRLKFEDETIVRRLREMNKLYVVQSRRPRGAFGLIPNYGKLNSKVSGIRYVNKLPDWLRDFRDWNLEGMRFEGSDMRHADFSRANLANTTWNVNLAGVNFSDSNLSRAYFERCQVRGSTFSRANLGAATFFGGDWSHVRFENCDMRDVQFTGINSSDMGFSGSDLRNAVITEYHHDVGGLDFRGANTEGMMVFTAKSDAALIRLKDNNKIKDAVPILLEANHLAEAAAMIEKSGSREGKIFLLTKFVERTLEIERPDIKAYENLKKLVGELPRNLGVDVYINSLVGFVRLVKKMAETEGSRFLVDLDMAVGMLEERVHAELDKNSPVKPEELRGCVRDIYLLAEEFLVGRKATREPMESIDSATIERFTRLKKAVDFELQACLRSRRQNSGDYRKDGLTYSIDFIIALAAISPKEAEKELGLLMDDMESDEKQYKPHKPLVDQNRLREFKRLYDALSAKGINCSRILYFLTICQRIDKDGEMFLVDFFAEVQPPSRLRELYNRPWSFWDGKRYLVIQDGLAKKKLGLDFMGEYMLGFDRARELMVKIGNSIPLEVSNSPFYPFNFYEDIKYLILFAKFKKEVEPEKHDVLDFILEIARKIVRRYEGRGEVRDDLNRYIVCELASAGFTSEALEVVDLIDEQRLVNRPYVLIEMAEMNYKRGVDLSPIFKKITEIELSKELNYDAILRAKVALLYAKQQGQKLAGHVVNITEGGVKIAA